MNRKSKFVQCLALGLAFMAGSQAQASPATPPVGSIYVSTTGSDTNDGSSPAQSVKTLAMAIQKAADSRRLAADTADHPNIWTMFKGAVEWADNVTTPVASPNNKCAMITVSANLSNRTPDGLTALHLQQLGYDVKVIPFPYVTQSMFTIAEANSYNLIVICESINSANADLLRDPAMTTPLIHMEPFAWDNFGYTSGLAGAGSNGPGGLKFTKYNILNNTTMNTGLPTGLQTFYNRPHAAGAIDTTGALDATANAGHPFVAGINIVATADNTVPANGNLVTMFTVEAGTPLSTTTSTPVGLAPTNYSTAPARAVGFGLFGTRTNAGTALTDDFVSIDNTNPTPKTIVVAGGTYPQQFAIGMMRNLTIQGGWNSAFTDQDPALATVLDAQQRDRVLYASNGPTGNVRGDGASTVDDLNGAGAAAVSLADGSVVDSLTLTNGKIVRSNSATALVGFTGTNIYRGGGIYSDGNPQNVTFRNCTISNNEADQQGGAIITSTTFVAPATGAYTGFTTNLKFVSCTFTGNKTNLETGSVLAAAGNGPSVAFDRCLFSNNTCPATTSPTVVGAATFTVFGSGMIFFNGDTAPNFSLTNSIIKGNSASVATAGRLIVVRGAVTAGQQLVIRNNTFFGNSCSQHLILDATNNAANFIDVANNIFVNNTIAGNLFARTQTSASPGVSTARNNLENTNTGVVAGLITPNANGNIAGDPLFVNSGTGDFHVPANSPAVNAGTNWGSSADYDGRNRPQQGLMDIGAFEIQASASNAVRHWTLF